MKLYHPIPADQKEKVLAKYGNRIVDVWHPGLQKKMWEKVGLSGAIALVEGFPSSARIEFQFYDDLGTEVPRIVDYSEEDVYNCPSVRFDKYKSEE